MRRLILAALAFALPSAVHARMLCTVVADASSGAIVHEEGDCRTRVTPASTFKLALAIMGFDEGVLKDAHAPTLEIAAGDPDWGGAEWRKPTDPQRWMKYSVVWFSQRITASMGLERLAAQTKALNYGNADVSGDPGQDNGLERSWISSSLKISPVEQADFLHRFLTGGLPVGDAVAAQVKTIVEQTRTSGWTVHGKTGSAFPRNADGSFDRARAWGWYVGWATDGRRSYTFARLDQNTKRESVSAGLRTRDSFIAAWPELAKSSGK